MATYQEIQGKLLNKVFNRQDLSQNIEIDTYTTSTNTFGEEVETFSVQTIVRGMALEYQLFNRTYDQSGLYKDASFILLVPYDTVVTYHDKVVFNSQTFTIIGISQTPLGAGFTHKQLFLKLVP